jgi:hypothetical protein
MLTPVVHEFARGAAHNHHCVACATHRRPHDVPFQQHAIGCPVRVLLSESARSLVSGRPQFRAA